MESGRPGNPFSRLAVPVTLAVLIALAGWFTVVGSDALWLAALGDAIASSGGIPDGIPFAAAPSGQWVNTTVLGQLTFSLVYEGGSVAVAGAQVISVAATLGTIALQANRRGARPGTVSVVVVALAIGAATPLLVARAQLLSLVPFVLLLGLLRHQQDRPSRAIWWVIPLLALWSNLHGAVLVGVAVVGCHLVFSRLRTSPVTAVAVGAAALAATCLNPGLMQAPRYYLGVFSGAATTDPSGMWGPLNVSNPFDLLLLLAVIVLGGLALRRRLPLWENVAALGLAVATVGAARHGIWLLLFLAVPAAGDVRRVAEPLRGSVVSWASSAVLLVVALLLCVAVPLVLRAPAFGSSDAEAARIVEATRGKVVLAPEPLAEALAASGAKVWVSNPLDAFTPEDQKAYLGFLRGDPIAGRRALDQTDVVVAPIDSSQASAARIAGFGHVSRVGTYDLFTR
jgi:hypothetical protein